MPTATIRTFNHFAEFTDEIRNRTKVGLEQAASECLTTIEGIWPHGGMHVEGVHPTTEGFASGVSAAHDKKHIAHFHDHGTLGNFRRGLRTEPKRPRKRNYKLTRPDGTPTGITRKSFYAKGRAAGRRRLLRSLGI